MSDADPGPYEPEVIVERPRRRWLSTIVVLIAIAFGCLVAWYLASNAKSGGASGPPGASGAPGSGAASGGRRGGRGGGGGGMVTVGTATAITTDVPITIDALGTVTSPVTATMRTQIAGRLFTVNFREGQMVKKGQLLAQVDPRPYQQLLDQAKGTLARDQALLSAAKVDLTRYQTLLKQDSIASQTVDTQAALVRQYAGTVTTDKGAVGAAQLNLGYTSVNAPVSGRAGLRGVDVGNYVSPGDTAGIVVITQISPIDVLFTLPQDRVPAVQARIRAGASLPVTALDRDGGAVVAQGMFSTLDNQIDTTTGTVRAKARFTNTDGALFPNQFVNARLLLDTVKGAVTIPATAVRNGPQGNFVFVVGPGSKAKLTPVTLGPTSGDNVSITSGIAAGTVVVTEGADKLKDGGAVMLPGAHGRGGPGAAGGDAAGASSGGHRHRHAAQPDG
ncbi:MdtA/MuxA family multidrug efflux RND transporter periplasmic adaptor subunit [Polymorphobacter sp. PAMC 29334]|uniref:MdtA/MuxA family multidrug efflux RND transporter periplasmic adaptor subunit n=1 Tax=Polymorphobacter sp. PAMC 29334 TaxID=2862331 RepID=UPI001C755F49|nr:MdtA/MuxA family multidrug efflux RND transporter periplasmic adaptor subunit [Polymorphobacter sp. PAMC 29334]QYE35119.1 MdtA/MuxA family multidrug efflux RND transporter periplasmic adaptor subunit [Polymorphobacter sp. PAMC 29334]